MESKELTEACKQGDRDALGYLYKAYSHKLLKICRHYVKDEIIAQDILHDAFIIIFTSITSLKDFSKLEGWMITIVRNLSLKYLRNTKDKKIPLSNIDTDSLTTGTTGNKETIPLDTLLMAIEALPKGHREVFKLSVLDGLSHKEIGELLGIAPHSSSSQLFRAKKILRNMLIKYWIILLLPVFIPLYIYYTSKNKTENIKRKEPSFVENHGETTGKQKEKKWIKKTTPTYIIEQKNNTTNRIIAYTHGDSIKQDLAFDIDSIRKTTTKTAGIDDSVFLQRNVSPINNIAVNNMRGTQKKRFPWTINFGYSSNPTMGDALSNLNYLSVVDYANGGATAKIYSWDEYRDYYNRNSLLMDSTERANINRILANNSQSTEGGLGERAHHYRPMTFGLSLNKQLSPRWFFGTGVNYTRLKSVFEGEFHKASTKKTQKIDYIGIPLRLTYRIWGKGKFNAYTTGGVTFEMPVHSSLNKEYIVTADSSYNIKGDIQPPCQWSVNLGIGIQYRIFKPFSFYIEPNMFYYFRNGSDIQTYRTEHPFTITVPFGLRLTW